MRIRVWVLAAGWMWACGSATSAAAQESAPKRVACKVNKEPPSEADAALSREDYDKALELYRAMAADKPEESKAGVIRTLLGEDKLREADDLAQAWVLAEPKSSVALEVQSEVRVREGEIPEAFKALSASFAMDLCKARTYLTQAQMEGMSSNYKSAKKHIELARKLDPEDVDIREAWISTLPHARRVEERKALLKEDRLLSEKDKKSLAESVAHAADYRKDACSVEGELTSAKIPLVPMMDGAYMIPGAGIDVSFNGKTRRMQLDTGASGIVLTKEGAQFLGLTKEARFLSGGIGDKGDVGTSTAHVATLKVGKVVFHNCEVEILDKAALDTNGLFGADVFSKYLVALDFPGREIRLEPLPARPDAPAAKAALSGPSHEEGGAIADDENEDERHDRYVAPEMRTWTAMYRTGHEILLPVKIGEAKSKLFMVDTGAGSMLISPDAAREVTKVKNDNDMHIIGVSGAVKQVYQTGKFQIAFANLSQKVDSMTAIDTTKVSHNSGVQISGFLGAPILFRLVVHIDYRDNLIKFDYDPMK